MVEDGRMATLPKKEQASSPGARQAPERTSAGARDMTAPPAGHLRRGHQARGDRGARGKPPAHPRHRSSRHHSDPDVIDFGIPANDDRHPLLVLPHCATPPPNRWRRKSLAREPGEEADHCEEMVRRRPVAVEAHATHRPLPRPPSTPEALRPRRPHDPSNLRTPKEGAIPWHRLAPHSSKQLPRDDRFTLMECKKSARRG